MSFLHTSSPTALRTLMSETVFSVSDIRDGATKQEDKPIVEKQHSISQRHVTENVNTVAEEFFYRGKLDKGILFILRYSEYPYFSSAAEDAFLKIIQAVGLQQDDVAILNLAHPNNPNDFKRIMSFFSPSKITLLGVEPKSLKLPEISHNSYMKGRIATVFNTFSFEEMFADTEKKRAFWNEFRTFINT